MELENAGSRWTRLGLIARRINKAERHEMSAVNSACKAIDGLKVSLPFALERWSLQWIDNPARKTFGHRPLVPFRRGLLTVTTLRLYHIC